MPVVPGAPLVPGAPGAAMLAIDGGGGGWAGGEPAGGGGGGDVECELRKLVLRPPVLLYGEWGADDEGPPPYPGKRTAAG